MYLCNLAVAKCPNELVIQLGGGDFFRRIVGKSVTPQLDGIQIPPPVGYPTRWGRFTSVVLYGSLYFRTLTVAKCPRKLVIQLGGYLHTAILQGCVFSRFEVAKSPTSWLSN